VQFDIQSTGGIVQYIFGGKGAFYASLKGPGQVVLQSMRPDE
jgi:uncharacterized protein (AIM24 family)